MNEMIKLFVMDVDGTLTDGKIYMGNNGEVMKAFSVKDGYGIHDELIPAGILPVIITCRKSAIVDNRCRELGITELFQGVKDKVNQLQQLVKEKGISLKEVAYIGDDLNDFAVMQIIKENGGLIGCPSGAVQKVKEIADCVCITEGGEGAVREFIEWIIDSQQLR